MPLGELANLANVAAIISFALVSYSTIKFRKDNPEAKRGFKVPYVNVIAPLSLVLFVGLLYSVSLTTWTIFLVWVAVGSIVYFVYSRYNSTLN